MVDTQVISSRTPEGDRFHCGVCGNDVVIEPSAVAYDATCPICGTLLWLSRYPRIASFIQIESLEPAQREWLVRFLMEYDDADAFDRGVLMGELQNIFNLDIPEEVLAKFGSVEDFIRWWEKPEPSEQ